MTLKEGGVRQRLPLNALRAFEATARLRSMSAAADELLVTHGAISRHIHSLEEQFGMPLLQRLARSVEPTPEGAALATQLTDAFRLMQMAVARLAPGPVTLSCSATIMMNWLIPRLSDFKRANPEIEIRLNINHGVLDFVQDQVSIAIRTSMVRAPQDVVIKPLLREQTGPLCHPDYVARHGLDSIEALSRVRILTAATRPNAWAEWTHKVGHDGLSLGAHESYEHFYLVIQAAACGLGVALAPRYLVENEMNSGALVAPFGFVESDHSLNLWIAPHERLRDEVRKLATWIEEHMEYATP